jgi:hypothetical protein
MEEEEGKKRQEAFKDPLENVRVEEKIRRFYYLRIFYQSNIIGLGQILESISYKTVLMT